MNNVISEIESRSKFGIKLGLDNIQTILNYLDNPQDQVKVIHIAGTNGKGSVSSMISSSLQAAGYVVAKYCSPYLMDLTEMFVIDDNPISIVKLSNYYRLIVEAEQANDLELTLYEVTTVIMFLHAATSKVDYLVLEVGLGGRLDATNVVNPEVSIITNISLDHTHILGNTVADIAFEKAGIIKPGVRLFTTELDEQALDVFKAKTKLITVVNPVAFYKLDYDNFKTVVEMGSQYVINLFGSHQVANFALSKAVLDYLEIEDKYIKQGVASCVHHARLEKLSENLIFDGAHNPASAKALVESMGSYNRSINLIFSVLKDKDIVQVVEILKQLTENLTFIPLPNLERGLSQADFHGLGINGVQVKTNLNSAIDESKLNLVCGTFSLYPLVIEYVCDRNSL